MISTAMYDESFRSIQCKKDEKREKIFKKFYSNLIEDYFDPDIDFLDKAMESFDSILFSLPEFYVSEIDMCGFMLKESLTDTCFAMKKFHDTAMEYTQLIDIFSSKKNIKICCLGSQGIFALLGICKVLEEFNSRQGPPHTCICLEVLDECEKWEPLFKAILNDSAGILKKLNMKFEYYSDDNLETIRSKIKSCDLVIAFKYFSRFIAEVVPIWTPKNILSNMKKKAVFFYTDYYSLDVKSLFPKTNLFKKIKSSALPEEYTFSAQTENFIGRNAPIDVLLSLGESDPLMFSIWFKNRKQEPKLPVGMSSMHKRLQ